METIMKEKLSIRNRMIKKNGNTFCVIIPKTIVRDMAVLNEGKEYDAVFLEKGTLDNYEVKLVPKSKENAIYEVIAHTDSLSGVKSSSHSPFIKESTSYFCAGVVQSFNWARGEEA